MSGMEWRDVVGYEGLYQVSNSGLIRSLDRIGSSGNRLKGRLVKSSAAPSGHLRIRLHRLGARQMHSVHQLVLYAFIGSPPPGFVCCHNDGDPKNNHVENLRWDTRSKNALDSVRHGTHAASRKTHCPQGHPYNERNTYTTSRKRYCRICHRAVSKASRLRKQTRMSA